MILILPPDIASKITDSLIDAGQREIGGILMGEHVSKEVFRVKEFTIQRKGGTFAAFVRFVEEIIAPLQTFFRSTKHDYTRFNYIGEWHSHHSFALIPSSRDNATMQDIIMDSRLGANFVVLMLVKLNKSETLECSVTVYQPNLRPFKAIVQQESVVIAD